MILQFKSIARTVEDFGGELTVADVRDNRPTAPAHLDSDGWLTFEGYAALVSEGDAKTGK